MRFQHHSLPALQGPALHSHRSSCSLMLRGDWPPRPRASPHTFGLQAPRRRLKSVVLGEGMEENMLMAFLCPDTPLLTSRKRPQECLVANGRVAVISWASLPPFRPPSTLGFSGTHGGAWCDWRGSSGQAGLPASPGARHGEGWRRRAFRQEVHEKRGSRFHQPPASSWQSLWCCLRPKRGGNLAK